MPPNFSRVAVLAALMAFGAVAPATAGAAAPPLAAPTFVESVHAVKFTSGRHAGRIGVDVGVRWGDFSRKAARGLDSRARHRATLKVERLGSGGQVLSRAREEVSLPLTKSPGRHILRSHFVVLPGRPGTGARATMRVTARQAVVTSEGAQGAARGFDRLVFGQALAGDAYVMFPLTSCALGPTLAAYYCGLSGPHIPFQASAGASLSVACPNWDFGQSAFTYGDGMPPELAAAGLESGGSFEGHWPIHFPDGSVLTAASTTVSGPGTVHAVTCYNT